MLDFMPCVFELRCWIEPYLNYYFQLIQNTTIPIFFRHPGTEPEMELVEGTVPNQFNKLFIRSYGPVLPWISVSRFSDFLARLATHFSMKQLVTFLDRKIGDILATSKWGRFWKWPSRTHFIIQKLHVSGQNWLYDGWALWPWWSPMVAFTSIVFMLSFAAWWPLQNSHCADKMNTPFFLLSLYEWAITLHDQHIH